MKKKREWITAEELDAKLESDPVWVAERDRRAAEHQARVEALGVALLPLEEELRAAGCLISDSGDLMKPPFPAAAPWPAAIPILLAHLQREYPKDARKVIATALAVPETKAAGWDLLVRLFRDEQEESVKDCLANAIEGAADDDVIDDMIVLVRDTRQGSSRLLLLRALERSKDPRAYATLVELANDPDLYKEIKIILKRLDRKMERKRARLMERKQKMH